VVPPPPLPIDMEAIDKDSPAFKTFTGPAPQAEDANTAGWRRADIGAANGHGNARSVARIMSVVARGGEVDGIRLHDRHGRRPPHDDLLHDEQDGTGHRRL
jgi:hypothetical protein